LKVDFDHIVDNLKEIDNPVEFAPLPNLRNDEELWGFNFKFDLSNFNEEDLVF
jgi:hypothetical protein